MKKVMYLPSGYKRSTKTTTDGRARTGEVSPQGLVSHTEHWDGRKSAHVQRSAIRYMHMPDGHIRPLTHQEMVDRGYWTVGQGPSGFPKKGKL